MGLNQNIDGLGRIAKWLALTFRTLTTIGLQPGQSESQFSGSSQTILVVKVFPGVRVPHSHPIPNSTKHWLACLKRQAEPSGQKAANPPQWGLLVLLEGLQHCPAHCTSQKGPAWGRRKKRWRCGHGSKAPLTPSEHPNHH